MQEIAMKKKHISGLHFHVEQLKLLLGLLNALQVGASLSKILLSKAESYLNGVNLPIVQR